jgi:hypothetical protein
LPLISFLLYPSLVCAYLEAHQGQSGVKVRLLGPQITPAKTIKNTIYQSFSSSSITYKIKNNRLFTVF